MALPDNKKTLHLGFDVGSTTVKVVVVDQLNTILWKKYQRHNARQPDLVRDMLLQIENSFPRCSFDIFITGSGGRAIAPHINAVYIQEVNALIYAVEMMYPDAGSVIELGGQDAKVIIWKGGGAEEKTTLTFMNDKCAGGTGATIDKLLSKIGLTMDEAAQIEVRGREPHHIAAKCGVFAETDVVGLLKAGVDKEEIFVSLCTAIAKQNLEVLVRGNVLRDTVLLLGGPHTYLKAFTEIWRRLLPETWKIHNWVPEHKPREDLILVPPDSQYFAAIGAVLFGKKSEELFADMHFGRHMKPHLYGGIEMLEKYLASGRAKQLEATGSIREGLVRSNEELEACITQCTIPPFKPPRIEPGTTRRGYIGIDGGSTSSKLVMLDEEGSLMYKDYVLSRGNPIVDIKDMFSRLLRWAHEHDVSLHIKGSAVTGYASAILKTAFGFDVAVVETVAHMRAAAAYYGDMDIICDVGGQDIKVLFMKHGRVVDFKLNTQCSAGNGYFLQSMAEQFGIPIEQYAEYAFKAAKAPSFNYGCAVFMEQDKVNFQQLGWTKEEIMAGLALVLPLNIWNYVVQEPNIGKFGNRFVLQGGTQKNLAAVKAQVDYIRKKVPDAVIHIHKYADICGAIGAALEIKNNPPPGNTSTFIGPQNAANITFQAHNNESTRCQFCQNKCHRTFIDIQVTPQVNARYISGYGCERGMSDTVDDMREQEDRKKRLRNRYPNLVTEAAAGVFREYPFEPLPENGLRIPRADYYPAGFAYRKKIPESAGFARSPAQAAHMRKNMSVGIPRLLNMYYYAPFFSTYFRTLGVGKIIYSDYTSAKLWDEGNKWGAIDPCFPAKVAPAHIYNLIRKKKCTHICFPMITHLQSKLDNTMGNNACVIQMGTPEVTHAVFTKEHNYFSDYNMEYWKPLVSMDKPLETAGLLYGYFRERLYITEDENAWAVMQGNAAMKEYLETLQQRGRQIISSLVDNDAIGILVIGHPYHHDPGLNHGILDEFQIRGFPVLCIESLPADSDFLKPLFDQGPAGALRGLEYDIKDVWMRNFNRNTNLKIWAAKIAARHPNLAVIDLSSFKCGHDAPTYSYIDAILDESETPHFLFHDIDQNKPGATFNIRIQTIDYFLRLEEKRLQQKVRNRNET